MDISQLEPGMRVVTAPELTKDTPIDVHPNYKNNRVAGVTGTLHRLAKEDNSSVWFISHPWGLFWAEVLGVYSVDEFSLLPPSEAK